MFSQKNKKAMNNGFDLAVCRPFKGWDILLLSTSDEERETNHAFDSALAWIIASRIFRCLSPFGGRMFIQMPTFDDYDSWTKQMNQTTGIYAENDANLLKIERWSEQATQLPFIPSFTS